MHGYTGLARLLRKKQTKAEYVLWQKLKNRRLLGFKFRRQVTIGKFIADFCCPEKRLIIELDGGIHAKQQAHDRWREEQLEDRNYSVLRFENHTVFEDMDSVIETITECLNEQPSSVSSPF